MKAFRDEFLGVEIVHWKEAHSSREYSRYRLYAIPVNGNEAGTLARMLRYCYRIVSPHLTFSVRRQAEEARLTRKGCTMQRR